MRLQNPRLCRHARRVGRGGLVRARAGAGHAGQPAPSRCARRLRRPSASADATPLIAVAGDGNVTLRVEQQPLEWVLEEIAKQSGWTDVQGAGAAGGGAERRRERGAAASRCAGRAANGIVRTAGAAGCRRRTALARERQRGRAVRKPAARALRRRAVPEQTLKWLYETDASERVRVAAFESYLELRADQLDALRETLEAALYVPSAAIQREAKQRLDVLHEMQRIDALPPHGGP